MKVTFSPKEYAKLLELAHLGLHVVAGHQGYDTPAGQRYAELEQKLFELATPLGCADLVTVGSDGRLAPSEKILDDKRLQKVQSEYDNDTFWHELVTRLSDRDLAAEQAKQSFANTGGPAIDADARLRQLEDGYWEEFEKNDLANLLLLRGGRG